MHAESSRRHNNDERHSSLEKYTSHFIWRVVCERELETEQKCNILTPTLLAITTFLSRFPGLLNPGPGGPASLGHVPQSSIFSPTATAQSGAWGPILLGAGFLYRILSLTHLNSNWFTSYLHPGYIIIWRQLFFLRASQFRTHSTRPRSML